MRATVTFFGKSTFAATLTELRKAMEISGGLEKIGKTRFATIWVCAIALDRCIPPLQSW